MKNSRNGFVYLVVFVTVLLLTGGGYYIYSKTSDEKNAEVKNTDTLLVTQTNSEQKTTNENPPSGTEINPPSVELSKKILLIGKDILLTPSSISVQEKDQLEIHDKQADGTIFTKAKINIVSVETNSINIDVTYSTYNLGEKVMSEPVSYKISKGVNTSIYYRGYNNVLVISVESINEKRANIFINKKYILQDE